LSEIQDRLAKLAIFIRKASTYRSIPLKQRSSVMNLYSGLLFLHGHITDHALAATLAASAEDRASTPTSRSPAMDLFKSLMYLGGRPMHSGHNFDLDESFEPSFGNHVASERVFGKTLSRPAPQIPRGPRSQAAEPCVQGCG